MKLHNLLLTAALFLTASAAFAAYDKVSWDITPTENALNVTVFSLNNGWDNYSVGAYSADNTLIAQKSLSVQGQTAVKLTKAQMDEVLAVTTTLTDQEKANLRHFNAEHGVYQLTVSFEETENVARYGLIGSNGGNSHLASSLTGTGVQGNDFHFSMIDGDSNVLFFGKKGWIGNFNNGDVFLVALTGVGTPIIDDPTPTQGNPLPAPVTTLLIALAFGGAFVMYRNRKQVKA